jgi:hypothetical protein
VALGWTWLRLQAGGAEEVAADPKLGSICSFFFANVFQLYRVYRDQAVDGINELIPSRLQRAS